MQIRVEIDGVFFPMGYSELASLVSLLQDNGERGFRETLLKLCTHPSSEVRTAVAARGELDKEMVKLLCQDASQEVLRGLVRNSSAWDLLEMDDVIRMIGTDVEVAKQAGEYLCYRNFRGRTGKVVELLATHTDPAVREVVTRSTGNVSRKTLRRLANDIDASVRKAAAEALGDCST